MGDLATIQPDPAQLPALAAGPSWVAELVRNWLESLSPKTLKAYSRDLADFARYLKVPGGRPELAIEFLLGLEAGQANGQVLLYRTDLIRRGLATATVGRQLAALRSVVKLAKELGRVSWTLGIRSPKVEPRRDVRGPDMAGWKKLWKVAKGQGDSPRARRDRAVLSLLYDLALRINEVLSLDLEHVNLHEATIAVLRKGYTERTQLTLPEPTRDALREWLEARGEAPGPVFVRTDRPGTLSRLTVTAAEDLVHRLGDLAKLDRPLRPHGLRHSSITAALDLGWDVRKVRKFAGHALVETTIRYDDARDDDASRIANDVAGKRR